MSVGNTYPRNVLSRRECLTILMRCFANNNTNELKIELRFLQVKHPIVSDRKIRRISTRSITLRPLTTGCLGKHESVRLGLGPQQLVVLHVCLDCPPAFVRRRSVPLGRRSQWWKVVEIQMAQNETWAIENRRITSNLHGWALSWTLFGRSHHSAQVIFSFDTYKYQVKTNQHNIQLNVCTSLEDNYAMMVHLLSKNSSPQNEDTLTMQNEMRENPGFSERQL